MRNRLKKTFTKSSDKVEVMAKIVDLSMCVYACVCVCVCVCSVHVLKMSEGKGRHSHLCAVMTTFVTLQQFYFLRLTSGHSTTC
jgi:hypothetical protein